MQINGVDKDEWDKFNHQHGTIFSSTKWLDLIGSYSLHGVYKGDELVGGFVNCDSIDVKLTPYHGVVLKDPSYEYSVIKTIAEIPNLKLMNHYSITDIRPFLWKGYKPVVRYTYIVDKDSRPDKQTRYDINHNDGLCKITHKDFIELYQETFERKGLTAPVTRDWMLLNYFMKIESVLYGNENSMTNFIWDKNRAYYIFGASRGHSARVVSDSLQIMLRHWTEVDMVGCNNEDIGNFKRGFGGKLKVCIGVQ